MDEIRSAEPRLSRYIHAKAAQRGYPCAGTFELTPRCNFDCKMCYVHLSKQEQEARGKELTAQQWISLGRQACAEGMVFLLLTGGEPTLRPDFPEIYSALKKMGLMISINSNGYLLRGEILELLRNDPPYRINISLYGTSNETYERLCGIAAYDIVMENVRQLRESGIDVKLNMSVTQENRADLQAVFEQASALGVHTQAASYMFPPVRISGKFGEGFRMRPQEAAQCEVNYNRLRMGRERFCAYAQELEGGVRSKEESGDCEGAQPGEGMRCRAGRSSFWLTWDGKLLPCGMMPEPAADALALGIAEAWRQIHEKVEAIRMPAACQSCAYAHGCHVCAAMCYCETGGYDAPPEYVCQMTRSVFSLTQEASCEEAAKEETWN